MTAEVGEPSEIINEAHVPERLLGFKDPTKLQSYYLAEVQRVSVLTSEEEAELAKRIEAGLVAEARLSGRSHQVADLRDELMWLADDGRRAKDEFIVANLRLVYSIVRRHVHRYDVMDLIQEGNLGLIRAVERFDYRQGFKFSTYASWWIRQAVSRAIADQSHVIRLPTHVHEADALVVNEWFNSKREGVEASSGEISATLALRRDEVEDVLRRHRPPYSLEALELAGIDLVEINAGAWHEDVVHDVLRREQLHAVLDTLSEREAGIISRRYGLASGIDHTLVEIGRVFGVSRERIRQLETKTLSKLRHPSRSDVLRDYLDDESELDHRWWPSVPDTPDELGTPASSSVADQRSFGWYARQWIRVRTCADRLFDWTPSHYLDLLDRVIMPVFGTVPWVSVTDRMVDRWLEVADFDLPADRIHAGVLVRTILRDWTSAMRISGAQGDSLPVVLRTIGLRGTPAVVRTHRNSSVGQPIRDEGEDGLGADVPSAAAPATRPERRSRAVQPRSGSRVLASRPADRLSQHVAPPDPAIAAIVAEVETLMPDLAGLGDHDYWYSRTREPIREDLRRVVDALVADPGYGLGVDLTCGAHPFSAELGHLSKEDLHAVDSVASRVWRVGMGGVLMPYVHVVVNNLADASELGGLSGTNAFIDFARSRIGPARPGFAESVGAYLSIRVEDA